MNGFRITVTIYKMSKSPKCPRDVQPHAYHMNAEALFVPIALKICLNFLVILRIDPDPDLFLTLSLLDGSALSIEEQEIFSQK